MLTSRTWNEEWNDVKKKIRIPLPFLLSAVINDSPGDPADFFNLSLSFVNISDTPKSTSFKTLSADTSILSGCVIKSKYCSGVRG